MISALISLLGTSFMGTLLGGVFALFNKKTEVDVKKLDLAHEQAGWAHQLAVKDKDLEYAKVEAAGRKDVAIVEGNAQIRVASEAAEAARFRALADIQAADKTTPEELKAAGRLRWIYILAEGLRKFIRPGLTIALVACALYLNWLLIERLVIEWPKLTPDKQYELGMLAFSWVTGQASAVLAYWFVSRGQSR